MPRGRPLRGVSWPLGGATIAHPDTRDRGINHLHHDVGSAAGHERGGDVLARDARQRAVLEVDRDPGPLLEPEGGPADLRAEAHELLRREDATATGLAPRNPLELTQLLERIDAHVRVGADTERYRAFPEAASGEEAVAQIGLRRGAGADRRAARCQQVEFRAVRVRRVYDGRPLAKALSPRQQLDRATPVLGETLLDLARLFVGVHVEQERLPLGVAPDLLQPVGRAGPYRVRRDANAATGFAQALDLAQVLPNRLLAETGKAAPRVRDVQEDELDPRRCAGLDCGLGLGKPEIVELAYGGVARGTHLAVGRLVRLADLLRSLALGLREHPFPPGPEVASRRPPPERALEGVAVRVDEPRQRDCLAHGGRR